MTGYVNTLADYLGSVVYAQAPAPVRERVRTALLYNLTMGLAGRAASRRMDDLIKSLHSAPGGGTVLGSGFRRATADAVFINAALITARGQNDTYPALVAHVGCVVIPAALGAAEVSACTGPELLTALLRGYETVAKIGKDAAGEANKRGFRSTPLFGVLGAAAATASVLRLTPDQTAHALAIAANSGGGLLQCWADGSEEWRLQVANASRLGYMAALYARAGIEGAPRSLEGDNGFFRAFGGAVPQLELSGWSIGDLTFKLYPGCAFNQTPVHVLRMLLAKEKPEVAAIRRIGIAMNPADANYPGVNAYGPFGSEAGAVMSAPFMLAATLRDSAPTFRHFSQQRNDERLNLLSRLVEIRSDPDMQRWHCRVEIELDSGRRIEMASEQCDPVSFTWDEVRERLVMIAGEWDGADKAARFASLAASICDLEHQHDVEALMAAVGRS